MGVVASFNPCFNGIFSSMKKNGLSSGRCVCFNPCFNGIFSSILEVEAIEDPIDECFNPCFNGIFSSISSIANGDAVDSLFQSLF